MITHTLLADADLRHWIDNHPEVTAVYDGFKTTKGVRSRRRCVVFGVAQKRPIAEVAMGERIPPYINGVPTDVIEGTYQALNVNTGKQRPCPAGFSIGHHKITAGTFGLAVRRAGEWLALTNNHVGANSNDATLGDDILQPGTADGGTRPAWATLAAFHPITFEKPRSLWQQLLDLLFRRKPPVQPTNRIDAALCRPINQVDLRPEIDQLGPVVGVVVGTLGLPVQKNGRTTGLTKGSVVGTNGFVRVQYGTGKIAAFENQLIIEGENGAEFSAGGDSGSAIVTTDMRVVGLLFAGGGGQTIANPIQDVFNVWPDLLVT